MVTFGVNFLGLGNCPFETHSQIVLSLIAVLDNVSNILH
jgi:hypothetical protein